MMTILFIEAFLKPLKLVMLFELNVNVSTTKLLNDVIIANVDSDASLVTVMEIILANMFEGISKLMLAVFELKKTPLGPKSGYMLFIVETFGIEVRVNSGLLNSKSFGYAQS